MAENRPKISIVIPTYNEATYVDRLLEALSKQTYKDFEVIVSDAQSKDGVDKVVKDFSNLLDIKLLESPPQGPAAGRNVGAKKALGEWLLFLDADDDIDDQKFIETLLNETEKRGWKTSSTKMKMRKSVPLYNRFGLAFFYNYQKLLAHTKRPVAQGYCIFTRRSVFEDSGGYNEKIRFGEDNEYVSRNGKHGFGFINDTYYYVDPRRNEAEGLGLVWRGSLNEVYRLFFGYKKLEKQPIKYEFGKHKKRTS
jgi:glycosyltransferase involved in cell wall biosynthesis